jgi:hypothetical protein
MGLMKDELHDLFMAAIWIVVIIIGLILVYI